MRRWASGLVVGMLLVLSAPAVATHVQEPTTPEVQGLTVVMLKYPDKTTRLACDGSDVVDFDQMRVHINVDVGKARANPSEHWDMKMGVLNTTVEDIVDAHYTSLWSVEWLHQNFKPHMKGNRAARSNLWNLDRHIGLWEVRISVKGLESGNTFDFVCLFEKTE